MAKTAEQALEAAVPAIGADRSKKYRDIIHLPMHQIGAKFEGYFCAVYLNGSRSARIRR